MLSAAIARVMSRSAPRPIVLMPFAASTDARDLGHGQADILLRGFARLVLRIDAGVERIGDACAEKFRVVEGLRLVLDEILIEPRRDTSSSTTAAPPRS